MKEEKQTVNISCSYIAGCSSEVELPCPLSEIESWYVKWDVFYFQRTGETEYEGIELDSEFNADIIDTKRPGSVTIFDQDYEVLAEGE